MVEFIEEGYYNSFLESKKRLSRQKLKLIKFLELLCLEPNSVQIKMFPIYDDNKLLGYGLKWTSIIYKDKKELEEFIFRFLLNNTGVK